MKYELFIETSFVRVLTTQDGSPFPAHTGEICKVCPARISQACTPFGGIVPPMCGGGLNNQTLVPITHIEDMNCYNNLSESCII